MDDRQNDGQSGLELFSSRRELLTRTELLVGEIALMGVPSLRPLFAATPDPKTYSGGTSVLEVSRKLKSKCTEIK